MVDDGARGLLPHVLVQGRGSCPATTINQACKVQPTSPGDLWVEGHMDSLWGTEMTSVLGGPERGSDPFKETGVFIQACAPSTCPSCSVTDAQVTDMSSPPSYTLPSSPGSALAPGCRLIDDDSWTRPKMKAGSPDTN